MLRRPLALLACLFLAACSGSRGTTAPTDAPPTLPEPAPRAPADISIYEDFDPGVYEEEAPGTPPEIVHDVPEGLMAGRPPASASRSAQGYRIQVLSAPSKPEADAAVQQATAWWRSQQSGGGSSSLFTGSNPPVYIVYRQPYYRVRVGNFASRGDALEALAAVRQQFPGASIVPDTVTVGD